jgi:hypothetical protein
VGGVATILGGGDVTEERGDRGVTAFILLAGVEDLRALGDGYKVVEVPDSLGVEELAFVLFSKDAAGAFCGKLVDGEDRPGGEDVAGNCGLETERKEDLGLSNRRGKWGVADTFRKGDSPLIKGDDATLDIGDD